VTLPQQRCLNIESHVLCSGGICLEHNSFGGITNGEFFVGPVSQAKYVVSVGVLLQLRFLLQIYFLQKHCDGIIIQVMLVDDRVERDVD
jgi:hypothetical protein